MKRPALALLLFVSAQGVLQAQEAYQGADVDERHKKCIAHIVYGETFNTRGPGRHEPIEGQFAVAWSIIFRAATNLPEYGGSDYCDVAYKRTPGRWQYDGAKVQPGRESNTWQAALWVAEMTLQGYGRPNVPVMYFCSVVVKWNACSWHDNARWPNGAKKLEPKGLVGGHRFYIDLRYPEYQLPPDQYQMASDDH